MIVANCLHLQQGNQYPLSNFYLQINQTVKQILFLLSKLYGLDFTLFTMRPLLHSNLFVKKKKIQTVFFNSLLLFSVIDSMKSHTLFQATENNNITDLLGTVIRYKLLHIYCYIYTTVSGT